MLNCVNWFMTEDVSWQSVTEDVKNETTQAAPDAVSHKVRKQVEHIAQIRAAACSPCDDMALSDVAVSSDLDRLLVSGCKQLRGFDIERQTVHRFVRSTDVQSLDRLLGIA